MKLSANFLLYLGSTGLLAQAGLWFVAASPRLDGRSSEQFHSRGMAAAQALLAQGRKMAPSGAAWVYQPVDWWQRFCNVNLTGTVPPERPADVPAPTPVQPIEKPIEAIIELVSLACDGASNGKGGDTHVVVRYKPDANVHPPEDVMRALTRPLSSGLGELSANVAGRNARSIDTRKPAPAPSTGPEILQLLRPGQHLWQDYQDIMLVEVGADAQSATFARLAPGAPPDSVPERLPPLFKSMTPMSKAVRDALAAARVARGEEPDAPPLAAAAGPRWLEVDETTRQGDTWHVGRNDLVNFGNDQERLLEHVYLDGYQSSTDSSFRGVQVRKVDPQFGKTYGVQQGDVLRSINDEPVRNKAEMINVIRKQYNVGTRTFRTRWLTANGMEVERVYQAPPGR